MTRDTPKTIPLRKNNAVETLEALLQMAKENKIGGFVAAGYAGSGVFVTTVDVNHVHQHELISQLPAGAILNTVREGIPRQ